MASRKLILMVEGESELLSVPKLVYRMALPSCLHIGSKPYKLGGVDNLIHWQQQKRKFELKLYLHGAKESKWQSFLRSARGAYVLALLDGDKLEGNQFCVKDAAYFLAESAQKVGAGQTFSLAITFVRQELESWLLAGCKSLYSHMTKEDLEKPEDDLPKGAKGKIKSIRGRYRETLDQPQFIDELDIDMLRSRNLRSFVRFEHALKELAKAAESGAHICTPTAKETR